MNKFIREYRTYIAIAVVAFVIILSFTIKYLSENSSVAKVHFLKNWTIYYEKQLDSNTIKNRDISVIDEQGKRVDCKLELAAFDKSIEVFPPEKGYEQGKSYTLKVGNSEECTIEKVFGKRKEVKFQIIKEAPDNTRIVFFDKNFESLIRQEIKKPKGEIGVGDVKNITSLVLTSKSIINLKGIEYFTNLHTLSLDVNRIKNIEPLKTLTDLNDLGLSNNQIADIGSLKDFKYLKMMFLLGNPIESYKALDNISKNLETKDFE
jgi:internalin A